MAPAAIEVQDLRRQYGSGVSKNEVLRGLTFAVEPGSTVGLLGVNGAGKTTLTKILGTLLLPTSGAALILGHNVATAAREVRRSIGVVLGGDRGLYDRLTGAANLEFFCALRGLGHRETKSEVADLLDRVGLAAAGNRAVETYSKGMRQRLQIAAGLAGSPRVLLLDEPTVGLDPAEAQNLRSTIRMLSHTGVTVLLTSHLLLDVEELADRVLALSRGTISADMSVSDFRLLAGFVASVTIRYSNPQLVEPRLPDGAFIVSHTIQGGIAELRFTIREWNASSLSGLGSLLPTGVIVSADMSPVRLEDAYKVLMGPQ